MDATERTDFVATLDRILERLRDPAATDVG